MRRMKPGKLPLVGNLLDRLVGEGGLTVIDPAGHAHRFGDKRGDGDVVIRLHDRALPLRLVLSPSLLASPPWRVENVDGPQLREYAPRL